MFLLLWPHFARAPCHWFLDFFLLSSPGVQSDVLLCCAPLGAATFRRSQSKKNTTQGVCFFLLRPRRKAGEGEAPLGAGTGPKHKKNTLGGVFFCSGPAERSRRPTGRNKQKTLCTPGDDSKKNLETNDTGHEQKGATKKKKRLTHCGPGPRCSLTSFPGRLFRLVIFLLRPRADAHSLAAALSGDASRRGGVFFAAAPPGPGWCFFFLLWPRPDAHSLTVGWGDFRTALVFFFFCCGPAEPGEPITKNVWCTTSGLKRPGGATAKKNTRRKAGEGEAPCRCPTVLLLPLPFAGAGAQKKHPVWCVFCSGPAERSRRPMGRNQKKHFAHPGTTAKKI